jgi:AAA domain
MATFPFSDAHGAFYGRVRIKLAWTGTNVGAAAKVCKESGPGAWKQPRPLSPDPGAAAGEFTTRLATRNPVIPAVANRLVLFDFDGAPFGELVSKYELVLPADAWRVPTPRGTHVYAAAPPGHPGLKVELTPERVTVITDGYLVGPGGRHPDGSRYALENVDVETASERPPAVDEALLERLHELAGGGRERVATLVGSGDPIDPGDRHAALMHHAAHLRGEGLGAKAIRAALEELQERFTEPTGRRDELDGIVRWVTAKPAPPPLDPVDVELLALLDKLPDSPPSIAPTKPQPSKRRTDPLGWDWLTAFATKPVVFLDRPFWQADAFHLKVGRKGVGKGTSLADLAARFSRGEMGPKRRVVWIGSEDSVSIDVKPRVLAAGGDPAQIAVVKDWLQLPRDIPRLEAMVDEVGDVGLLVIDPVGNHIVGQNSNDETDVRAAIAHLNALADRFALVAVGVRHLTEKEAKSGLLAAILGSSAWVQVPRAVIALARDPHDAAVVHMQVVAGNRMPPGTSGRCFRIEAVTVETDDGPSEVSRVVWDGDSTIDVEELLAARHEPPEPSRSGDARALMLATLHAAPGQRMGAEELDALIAEQAGVSAKTVRNLRGELGANGRGWLKAIPVKDEFGEVLRWDVGLTAGAPEPEPDVPEPDPIPGHSSSGLFKPKTGDFDVQSPTARDTGSGSGTGHQDGADPAPPGCREHPDAGLWLTRDGTWRCPACDPPAFPGEVLEERET